MNTYEALEIVLNLAQGLDTLVNDETTDKYKEQQAALDKVVLLQQKHI